MIANEIESVYYKYMAAKTEKKTSGKLMGGIILVILGSIFLMDNYGFVIFDIGRLWPLFLIIPGIFIIRDYNRKV